MTITEVRCNELLDAFMSNAPLEVRLQERDQTPPERSNLQPIPIARRALRARGHLVLQGDANSPMAPRSLQVDMI